MTVLEFHSVEPFNKDTQGVLSSGSKLSADAIMVDALISSLQNDRNFQTIVDVTSVGNCCLSTPSALAKSKC